MQLTNNSIINGSVTNSLAHPQVTYPQPVSSIQQTLDNIQALLQQHNITMSLPGCEELYKRSFAALSEAGNPDFINITSAILPGRPQPKIHIYPKKSERVVNLYVRNRSYTGDLETEKQNEGSVKLHRKGICRLTLDFKDEENVKVTARKVSQLTMMKNKNENYRIRFLPSFNQEIEILKRLRNEDGSAFLLDSTINFNGSRNKESIVKSVAYVETYDSNLFDFLTDTLEPNRIKVAKSTIDKINRKIIQKTLKDVSLLHTMGYKHGDLKSDNILIRFKTPPQTIENLLDADNLESIVTDFDQSQLFTNTQFLGNYGTPMTMGPEALAYWLWQSGHKLELTDKSDMWSLGALFTELCTGNLPRWSALLWAISALTEICPRTPEGAVPRETPPYDPSSRTIRSFNELKPYQEHLTANANVNLGEDGWRVFNHINNQLQEIDAFVNRLDPNSLAELFGDNDFTAALFEALPEVIFAYSELLSGTAFDNIRESLRRRLQANVTKLVNDLRLLILITWDILEKTPLPSNAPVEHKLIWSLLRPKPTDRPNAQEALATIY